MAGFMDRMLGAAKLDAAVYEEVERDEEALGQALVVVILSSVAAGIGGSNAGPIGLIGGALATLVGWGVWALVIHFVGTTMLAEPQTESTIGQVLRTTGFAMVPGVIRVAAFIPILGWLINLAATVWMIAAFVVAVRQALDFSSTGRAVLVVVIGWIVQMIIFGLLALIGMGGFVLMAF